jgi:hypothetical protein
MLPAILYEVHTVYNFPASLKTPTVPILHHHHREQSQKVLSIYRNWAENVRTVAENYFVHFQYMPGLGFYGIGLIHLIG